MEADHQVAALRAELELQESFVEELRRDLASTRAELEEALRQRDQLQRELADSPRWREHADALQEHIEALRARASVRVADRAHVALTKVPGGIHTERALRAAAGALTRRARRR